MTISPADVAAADADPGRPTSWQAVMETLVRKYPLVPRAIVARAIRDARQGGGLAYIGEALVVKAIADGNVAAIHQALSQGARLACQQTPGSRGDRLPRPGTAGDPLDQAGREDAAER